jgi:hypothetical protein
MARTSAEHRSEFKTAAPEVETATKPDAVRAITVRAERAVE